VITNLTRDAFRHAGFAPTADFRSWNISWGRQYALDRYRCCESWQKISHFAGARTTSTRA
jgi:tubulin polyglutamylase TTLL4